MKCPRCLADVVSKSVSGTEYITFCNCTRGSGATSLDSMSAWYKMYDAGSSKPKPFFGAIGPVLGFIAAFLVMIVGFGVTYTQHSKSPSSEKSKPAATVSKPDIIAPKLPADPAPAAAPDQLPPPAGPPPLENLVFQMEKGAVIVSLKDGKVSKQGEVDMSKLGDAFWKSITITFPAVREKLGREYLLECALKENPQIVQQIGGEFIRAFIRQQQAQVAPPVQVAPQPPEKK